MPVDAEQMATGTIIVKLETIFGDQKAALYALLSSKIIVVEHRNRLIRFGFKYLEAALAAQGRKILVVDHSEVKDDLIRDMTEMFTSFCARLYGKRTAKHKAEKAI